MEFRTHTHKVISVKNTIQFIHYLQLINCATAVIGKPNVY